MITLANIREKLIDAINNSGMKQCQLYRKIRVFVDQLHENIADRDLHIQLFPALPDQSLIGSFPRFYFASHKLPKGASCFVSRALAGQEPVPFPDQCCDNMGQSGYTLSVTS